MTGHNHYSNCTCGWCVNNGRARFNREQALADLRRRDAISFLERNSARSISSCYVNPNARCPVCGASVFFYANQSGSRVYFDDLGHPWPKHPCTDNPRRKLIFDATPAGAPLRRPRGLAKELVGAARMAGRFSAVSADAEGWRLLVVLTAERSDDRNVVTAEFLDAAGGQFEFSCFSPQPLLEAGDFISEKGGAISFLNRATMTAVTIKNGAPVVAVPVEFVEAKVAAPKQPVVRQPLSPRPKPVSPPVSGTARHYDMTQAEAAHFHSAKTSVADMCDKFGPIVKSYARTGTRKPRDVAVRLNGEGYRTATGAHWTPRLSHFLLGLIFTERTSQKPVKQPSPKPVSASRSATKRRESMPLTQADLIDRLSALGRVVVKDR